jgi:tetratricopeptide (TPR) repeat protein
MQAPKPSHRLESWKEIASYLGRTVRTVQRWEASEGLPVHRHVHQSLGNVYAFPDELDRWISGRQEKPVVPKSRRWMLPAVFAVVLIAAAGGWLIARSLRPSEPAWLLVTALDNRTGEALLDDSVPFLLEREISNSSGVYVAPQARVEDSLRLMRKDPNTRVDESLGREAAIRDGGISLVVSSRAERTGSAYLLTASVIDAASGRLLGGASEQARSIEDIAPAVRRLASTVRRAAGDRTTDGAGAIAGEIRRRLGEEGLGGAPSERLEKATTPSLAALRAFSLGMRKLDGTHWEAAAALLEEATREDPQFASAHIYAAHCYHNVGKMEMAAPHFEAAFRLASGVSERERLFILGSYYQIFHQDNAKALAAYEALTNLYPDDFWGLNNLSYLYAAMGRHKDKMEATKRLHAIRPHEVGFTSVADLGNASDRWSRGDVKGAAKEVARVSAHAMIQTEDEYTLLVAFASLTLGRFAAATSLCGHVGDSRSRHECFLRTAYLSGNQDMCRDLFSQIRSKPPPPIVLYSDVILAVRLGEIAIAKKWVREYGLTPGNLDGEILLAEGHPEQALEKIDKSPAEGDGGYPLFFSRLVWARALEQQGKIEEAIVRLEEDTRPSRAKLPNGWNWPECRVKLAELYRKAGREQDAVRTENEIRLYLSEADPDHPILVRLNERNRRPFKVN